MIGKLLQRISTRWRPDYRYLLAKERGTWRLSPISNATAGGYHYDTRIELEEEAGRVVGQESFQPNIRCANPRCGCRRLSFVWVSARQGAIYFEVPKSASTSVRTMLQMGRPSSQQVLAQVYLASEAHASFNVDVVSQQRLTLKSILALFDRLEGYVQNHQNGPRHFRYFAPGYTKAFKPTDFELFYGTPCDALGVFPDYFSFSFVRNPLDRMISNWLMFTQQNDRARLLEPAGGVPGTFADFCELTRAFDNHHWNPQVAYLPIPHGNKVEVNVVGRLESFDEDWNRVTRELGVSITPLQSNKAKRSDARDILTPSIRQSLLHQYHADFEMFYPEELR